MHRIKPPERFLALGDDVEPGNAPDESVPHARERTECRESFDDRFRRDRGRRHGRYFGDGFTVRVSVMSRLMILVAKPFFIIGSSKLSW